MGTRSITQIRENGKPLVTVYTQFDGYLSGVGAAIAKSFITENPDPANIKYWKPYNDAHNLAAVVFANIMAYSNIEYSEAAGIVVKGYNVYIAPDNNIRYGGPAYTYIIDVVGDNNITISVNGNVYDVESFINLTSEQ